MEELNPGVRGEWREVDLRWAAAEGGRLGFLAEFSLVLASGLTDSLLAAIDSFLWAHRIPLVVVRSYGHPESFLPHPGTANLTSLQACSDTSASRCAHTRQWKRTLTTRPQISVSVAPGPRLNLWNPSLTPTPNSVRSSSKHWWMPWTWAR